MTTTALSTATVARIAAELLSLAGDEFGNHGCNDFDLNSLGISHEEQVAFVTYMGECNGDPKGNHHRIASLPMTYDFGAMYACAEWLRKLAEEKADD